MQNNSTEKERQLLPRILILEKEKELQEVIKHALSGIVCDLYFEKDGKRGLTLLLREPFALLVTEVLLPGIDGIGILSILRKRKYRLPVIFITSLPDRALFLEARKMGVKDFLLKPFEEKRLRQVVKDALLAAEASV